MIRAPLDDGVTRIFEVGFGPVWEHQEDFPRHYRNQSWSRWLYVLTRNSSRARETDGFMLTQDVQVNRRGAMLRGRSALSSSQERTIFEAGDIPSWSLVRVRGW